MEGKKYSFRVLYRYPDLDSYTIFCETNLQNNGYKAIMVDGSVLDRRPTIQERPNVLKFVIRQQDKWQGENGSTRLFGDFSYYTDEDYISRMSAGEKLRNTLCRMFHDLTKEHENFIIKDKVTGNNVNLNTRMALLELEDTGSEIVKQANKNELATSVSNQITELYKNPENNDKFIDLCYALGVLNVHKCTKQELYNAVMGMVKISPERVEKVLNSSKQWLLSLIEKGLYLPITIEGETAIPLEGDYYMLNGNAIGKTKEELVQYFEANGGALKLLEQKLGTYHERVKLPVMNRESTIDTGKVAKEGLAKVEEEMTFDQKQVKMKLIKLVKKLVDDPSEEAWKTFDAKFKIVKEDHASASEYADRLFEQLVSEYKIPRREEK